MLCLSGDLTRQCEVDLFQEQFPDRFIHGGMAEANMMSMAGALARCGHIPFVHTFGVFATRRPFDQIANAIAYPALPVRIVGFMPGISTPGGPSHQATDDVALMRALPGMTVVDVADAVEVRQVVEAVVDVPGPVYIRLKRGEIPVIFDEGHVLRIGQAEVVAAGHDVALFASGMMLAAALAAARALGEHAVSVSVINVPTIKPLDTATVLGAAAGARIVVPRRTTPSSVVSGRPSPKRSPRPDWVAYCAGPGCATPSPRGRPPLRICSVSTACSPRPLLRRAGERSAAVPGAPPPSLRRRTPPSPAAEPGEYVPV